MGLSPAFVSFIARIVRTLTCLSLPLPKHKKSTPYDTTQHQQRTDDMGTSGNGMVILLQTAFGQKKLPIVEAIWRTVAEIPADKRQRQAARIIHVGCHIDKVLTKPPYTDRGPECIASLELKHEKTDQRHQKLAETSSQRVHESTEKPEQDVPRLVKWKIDQVHETVTSGIRSNGYGNQLPAEIEKNQQNK